MPTPVQVPVIGTDYIRKKLTVSYDGRRLEVDAYHFQLQSGTIPKKISVFIGRDRDGLVVAKQDISGVLDTLFEEECTYKFKIAGVMEDTKTHSKYLSLKDEYGLTHRLYEPNAKGLAGIGRIIDCTVVKMENGHLHLASPMYQTVGDVPLINNGNTIDSEEYRLFNILHEKRANQYASLNDHSMRGVWSSVIDKYPDSAHFVYELLQNADDAEASEVTIILDKDVLYFKHNGRIQFTVTDDYDETIIPGHINAIVAIGDSTKGKNGQQKIGKFGVGFKAVFDYTDTPIVYTDTFKFKIENYIVPELIAYDNPNREKGETLFEIPFKEPEKAYNEIRQKLQNLNHPILFLNNVRKVIWKDAVQFHHEKVYSKMVVSQITKGDVICQKVHENMPNGVKRLWLFSRSVSLGERGTWPISVGFFLTSTDKKEMIDTSENQKVYCFFPTAESFGTCFISHAPFLLVDNRQQIKRNEDINKTLQKAIVSLSCESLTILRDIGIESGSLLIDSNILKIAPQHKSRFYYGEEREDLFSNEALYKPFLSTLKNEALFLSRDGLYLRASEIKLSQPVSLTLLLSRNQLQFLWGADDNSIDFMKDAPTTKETGEWKYLTDEVGVNVISTVDFARKVTSDFMKNQSMEWVLKLYSFLSQEARETFLPRYEKQPSQTLPFRYAPIVKTEKDEWIPPYKGDSINVFFDDDNSSGYNVVNKEYFSNERALKFLTELGVKEPEMGDFIKSKVLAKYKSGETIYVNDVITDFQLIYQYSQKIPRNEYAQFILEVQSSYKFLCIEGESKNLIRRPNEVYYPTRELKLYFGRFSETLPDSGYSFHPFYPKKIYFLDEKSYKPVFKDIESEKLQDFLRELGIRYNPYPEKVGRIGRYDLNDTQKTELSADSYKVHPFEHGEDYRVDGLLYALQNNLSHRLSVLLWKWLYEWKTDDCNTLTYHFHYYQYIIHTCDASYVDILKHTPWIYVNRRTVKAPDELCVEDMRNLTDDYPYSPRIMSLLNIQRKSVPLVELGANEEQIGTYQKGQVWESILKKSGLSEKEARRILEKAGEEKRARVNRDKPKESIGTQGNFRKEMQDYSSSETFGEDNGREPSVMSNNQQSSSEKGTRKISDPIRRDIRPTTTSDKIDEIKRRHQEDQDREIREEDLRENINHIVANGGKYTKEWFEKLLELEYLHEGDNIETFGRKSITLSFSRVERESDSDRIYILKNASSIVPLEIEQIGGLEVHFSFYKDIDDISFGFEVASVKDFTLRLKAKIIDSEKLKEIDWDMCTRATVQINNPVALIRKLSESFKCLGLDDGQNLKDSLSDNISFVFGPPGTGKTTYLAERITNLINDNEQCRILVLTPTNKACDVIANKIVDMSDSPYWMGRFLTTGTERLENEGYVCDKNSDLYQHEKCCVITTTARLPYDGFGTGYDNVLLNEIEWDYVIIDEASMIPLAHVVYAIYRFSLSKIIIAGDPMQIMPIVREDAWKNENIYTMVNLNRFDNPKTEPRPFEIINLDTQYRSVPAIGRLFSEFAYQGRLRHHRTPESIKPLSIKGFEDIKPINFITFKVDKYDNICGAKKLSSSNVHIYSVLLVAEMCQYVAKQFEKTSKKTVLKIGIICPYAAQAQLIEKLLEQFEARPRNVDITTGTIHGFQGDECDMIFAVFNPPKGLKFAPERVLVNNWNILNVAISRARDYLFILMPQKDTDGFDNLKGIIRIGRIAIQDRDSMTFMNADSVEERLFKEKGFIENNTFVTTHQMTNIYSSPVSKYEVRIDDSSVDIQIAPIK